MLLAGAFTPAGLSFLSRARALPWSWSSRSAGARAARISSAGATSSVLRLRVWKAMIPPRSSSISPAAVHGNTSCRGPVELALPAAGELGDHQRLLPRLPVFLPPCRLQTPISWLSDRRVTSVTAASVSAASAGPGGSTSAAAPWPNCGPSPSLSGPQIAASSCGSTPSDSPKPTEMPCPANLLILDRNCVIREINGYSGRACFAIPVRAFTGKLGYHFWRVGSEGPW